MSEIYLDVLDSEQKQVFRHLAAFKDKGYLAGGTALALQLRHRKSVDFDIFLSRPLTRQFLRKVRQVFGEKIEPRVSTGDLLLVRLENGIEAHFVNYWYERLEDTVATESISLAAVADIAADKAHTIGRRGTWRDYVDIFYLLNKEVFSLQEIIDLAKKKFDGEFAAHLFLQQLVYYKDIEDFEIKLIEGSFTVEEMQEYLIEKVKEYKEGNIERN